MTEMPMALLYEHIVSRIRSMLKAAPKKLLFEHIPKCGGTTVINFLSSQYAKSKVFLIDGSNTANSIALFKALPQSDRHDFDLIIGHGAHRLRKFAHPEILKATIFRDPVDRIVSHYYYVKSSPAHYLYDKLKNDSLSLLDYATSDISGELRNTYVNRFLDGPSNQLENYPEQRVALAFSKIVAEYDVVGVLEKLDVTMNKMVEVARLPKTFRSQKLNVTTKRPSIEAIDPETINAIREVNNLDMQLYDMIRDKYRY